MSKKEKIKKYLEEHKDVIIREVRDLRYYTFGVVVGMATYGVCTRLQLDDLASRLSKVTNETYPSDAPVNFRFIGNALKGFYITDVKN